MTNKMLYISIARVFLKDVALSFLVLIIILITISCPSSLPLNQIDAQEYFIIDQGEDWFELNSCRSMGGLNWTDIKLITPSDIVDKYSDSSWIFDSN